MSDGSPGIQIFREEGFVLLIDTCFLCSFGLARVNPGHTLQQSDHTCIIKNADLRMELSVYLFPFSSGSLD